MLLTQHAQKAPHRDLERHTQGQMPHVEGILRPPRSRHGWETGALAVVCATRTPAYRTARLFTSITIIFLRALYLTSSVAPRIGYQPQIDSARPWPERDPA